jgi:hypothetical protein
METYYIVESRGPNGWTEVARANNVTTILRQKDRYDRYSTRIVKITKEIIG